MLLPFNEISLSDLDTKDDIVRFFGQIEDLVKLLNLKKLPDIVFGSTVLSNKIDDNSNLYDLITNCELSHENKTILFSIIQNTPFIEEMELSDFQIKYNDIDAYGLTYAHLNDIPSISIPQHPWFEFIIAAQKEYLNTNADLVLDTVQIKHIGDLKNSHGSWFADLLPDVYYTNSNEFLDFCDSRFARIQLSNESVKAIKALPLEKIIKMERSFQILNDYCENYWKFGSLRSSAICELGLHLRPESDTTMQMFGEQRNFKNEEGITEQFTLHFDVSEGERSYLKGLTQAKEIFIAYVGPHLSTKKFPK